MTDRPLDRGHIQRHADDGDASLENLIPLCRSCNAKYKKTFTPDSRPADWRDRFFKLLIAEMRVGILTATSNLDCNIKTKSNAVENKRLVILEDVEFAANFHYIQSNVAPQPMTAADAERLMWKLVKEGDRGEIRPNNPSATRQSQMKALAVQRGEEAFMLAGREFLRQARFVIDDRGKIQWDSWQDFCDSFRRYHDDATARASRLAEQEKRERELRKKADEEAKVWQQERLLADYLLALTTPDWPGMPDADRAFKESVAVEGEVGELSLGVVRRYKHHATDELLAEKQKLRDKLAQCVKWAKAYDADGQRELAKTIRDQSDWIDRAKTVEELLADAWTVDNLHTDLDPDRPRPTDVENF